MTSRRAELRMAGIEAALQGGAEPRYLLIPAELSEAERAGWVAEQLALVRRSVVIVPMKRP